LCGDLCQERNGQGLIKPMNHIRVAHASDLHGNILPLKNVDVTKIDAWILNITKLF
jgi:hypothetical protein